MGLMARLSGTMAVVVALAGCAETPEPTTAASDRAVWQVVDEVYGYIYERYLEPVTVDDVTMTGLQGLHGIDPALDVKRAGGVVWLSSNDKLLAKFKAPAKNDVDAWSALTVKMLNAGREASEKLRDASTEKIYESVFDSALAGLDRFSRYASAEEASDQQAQREGFGGIGVRIRIEGSLIRVVSITPGGPAARAGVEADDVIARIDGTPTADLSLRQVVRLLRGRRGSRVNLSLARDDSAGPVDLVLVRRHIVPPTVTSQRKNGTLYVRLSRFNRRSATTLADAVNSAREDLGPDFRGLILDLRNNPGGLLDQAVRVSDLFLDSGRIVTTEGRHPGSFQQYDAKFGDILGGLPIVVMVNGRSASSSEIVAAALQDLGRAVVVGSNSYGKGTVQSVFPLRNSGELTLTWSRFHAPSGYALHNLGVMPSVCTGGDGDTAAEAVAQLRAGRSMTKAALKNWRKHLMPGTEDTEALRAACPSSVDTGGETDAELIVARRIIADNGLYQQALALLPSVDTVETVQSGKIPVAQ